MKRIFVFIAACACMLVSSTTSKAQLTGNHLNGGDNQVTDKVGTVSYLLGVNYGMMINSNNFFENMDEMNVFTLMKGLADAMNAGQPNSSNPYSPDKDAEWAQKFQVNPYDMNQIFNDYLAGRASSKAQTAGSRLNDVDTDEVGTVSYLLGVNLGMMINSNDFFENMDEMNVDMLMKGLADAMNAGQPQSSNPNSSEQDAVWAQKFQVNPYDMNQILNDYLADRAAEKAELNKKLGEEFLAENARRPEVQVTESGLQYVMHSAGSGEKVGPDDTAVVNYRGTLTDGTEFDSSDGIEISPSRVIPGMAEGLELLAKGGKATFYIPADLAYGENAPRGSVIKPNSVLVFEVEVIDIIRN